VSEWVKFDENKGYNQVLPEERKLVLVMSWTGELGYPPIVSLGYLRYSSGDRDCPFFVAPGSRRMHDCSWSDCLPKGFKDDYQKEYREVFSKMKSKEVAK
jgi:hypothetical protein